MNGNAFCSQCGTESSPISFSGKVKLKQVLFSTGETVFNPRERTWMSAVRGQGEGWGKVLHRQKSSMGVMLVMWKP